MIRVLLLFAFCFAGTTGLCYSPVSPFQYLVSGRETQCFFVLLPSQYRHNVKAFDLEFTEHQGIAYRVKENGDFERLWRINGWYAFPGSVFLSQNGRYLVRIREIGNNFKRPADLGRRIVLTFYRDGKMLRAYRCSDLVNNPAQIFHPPPL